MLSVILAVLYLASGADGQIVDDFNCTVYDGAATPAGFVYTERATVCDDVAGTATCKVLMLADPAADPVPTPGATDPRPVKCYGPAAGSFDSNLNKIGREQCAKTCGYCCISPAYNCDNARFPRLNCATITNSQCRDATWRPIIAADCPSACGFCNDGGCVDAVIECANDRSICGAVGMQDFVNANCQRTCARCASSTTAATGTGTGTCTTFIPNSSTACASWAANGFCTNTFYTVAQRRSYCATTCRIC